MISQTFGAALWVLGYALRAASSNVSIAYFHHGPYPTSHYTWWTPYGVTSPYYGGFAATMAMARGSYISALDDGTTDYAGYVIFSRSRKPIKLVLINSNYFGGTGKRCVQQFVLGGLCSRRVVAKRLTATSALSRQDEGDLPTFGGQVFSNQTCQAQGRVAQESASVQDGTVTFDIGASEALLIEL